MGRDVDSLPGPPGPPIIDPTVAVPVVRWAPAALNHLETSLASGIVVVSYSPSRVIPLWDCQLAGVYDLSTASPKTERWSSLEGMGAGLHAGAVPSTGAQFEHEAAEQYQVTFLGRRSSDRTTARTKELVGKCAGATHFVRAADVGYFHLLTTDGMSGGAHVGFAGAAATAGGSYREQHWASGGTAGPCLSESECASPLVLQLEPILPTLYVHVVVTAVRLDGSRDWDDASAPDLRLRVVGGDQYVVVTEDHLNFDGELPLVENVPMTAGGVTVLLNDDDGVFSDDPVGAFSIQEADVVGGRVFAKAVTDAKGREVGQVHLRAVQLGRDTVPVL